MRRKRNQKFVLLRPPAGPRIVVNFYAFADLFQVSDTLSIRLFDYFGKLKSKTLIRHCNRRRNFNILIPFKRPICHHSKE